MTENRANVDVARTQNNYAIQNLAEVLGEVEVWKKEVNSRVASTQALISISCQLDRIANALEAQGQKPEVRS